MSKESKKIISTAGQDRLGIDAFFGPLPGREDSVNAVLSHELQQSRRVLREWQVQVGEPAWLNFTMYCVYPTGQSSFPILLSPDGCWPHVLSAEAIDAVIQEGVALAWFNRTELAFDNPDCQRRGPVHSRWPEGSWSALSVWAWGLMICADVLSRSANEVRGKLGAVGHSRGGKAALLAALLDARFDAVVANNSGTGGAASLRVHDRGCETLFDLVTRFPHWCGPDATDVELQQRLIAEDAPINWLTQLAPRGLCVLQAKDDFWANPTGAKHLVESLQTAWSEHPHRLRWVERLGGHAMTRADWREAARFMREL